MTECIIASLIPGPQIVFPPIYGGQPIKNSSPFPIAVYGADRPVTLQIGEEAWFEPNPAGGWLVIIRSQQREP
jgi:hypothetical protein